MKRKIIRTIESLVFIILFIISFDKLSFITKVYGIREDDVRNLAFSYVLPKNSVDVVFLGDSHVFTTYINEDIFNETGIRSTTVASSMGSIVNCYWELKEFFSRQKNVKYVVMDIQTFRNTLCDSEFKEKPLSIVSSFPNMPELSIYKWACYFDIKVNKYGASEKINLFDVIGLLQYRDDLDRNYNANNLFNLLFNPSKEYKNIGYIPLGASNTMSMSNKKIMNEGMYIDFFQTIEYDYLEKIKKLCDKHNCKLIFTNTPYFENDEIEDRGIKPQMISWCKKNNIQYLDYYDNKDEIGLDLDTDFMDCNHFNYNGAVKTTKYFSQYLVKIDYFVGRRNDKKVIPWFLENIGY